MQEINKHMKINLWLLWLIIWPFSLWMSYTYGYINIADQGFDILLFAFLMGIVALFPMTANQQTIFFVNGVSMVVFLVFGLFIEIVLSACALLIVLARLGVGTKDIYRIPLNFLLFTGGSIVGAFVYNIMGGSHFPDNLGNIQEWGAIFGYAITIFVVNQIFITLIDLFLYKRKRKFFDQGLRWESAYSLLYIPIGLIIYIMYVEVGLIAVPLAGIPYIFIAVIFKLLFSYHHVNHLLGQAGNIGHRLTKRLETQEIYDVFVEELVAILPVDYACIYQVSDGDQLYPVREYQQMDDRDAGMTSSQDRFSDIVMKNGKPLLFKRKKQWGTTLKTMETDRHIESVLSVPVVYNDATVGVVTLLSSKRRTFETVHKRILDILTNYLGVAVENAESYKEKTQLSERDGLTQLYNYRYLSSELSLINGRQSCSLLVLDLDRFKSVNDQYGHEAGNDILRQLAHLLDDFIDSPGITARYGGEEFVMLLPDVELEMAEAMAERLRKHVADTRFVMYNHILTDHSPVTIHMTVSIGVAAYPDHCDDLTELVRYADSALYLGAKEQGRNKVAVFHPMQPT